MKRIAKLSTLATTLLIVFIPVFTLLVWFNWNELFGNKRSLEALHSLYELELKENEMSAMKNINNDTEFLVKGENLTPFFTLLEDRGYSIVKGEEFLVQKGNSSYSVKINKFQTHYSVINVGEEVALDIIEK
ncbi:hypothetical protein [Priestia endophytica]|uniref:hypothetical protein n=1 Tax=Priestia endophytica TaxID=135735 RepID=UPI000F52B5DA|nr:hypothetical protein [Priestia endophytica]MED4073895.1 hypothetical protein [Priestia endophytica]RPK05931.1 hypothetical protein FH5_01860 [Priestia endophytica]